MRQGQVEGGREWTVGMEVRVRAVGMEERVRAGNRMAGLVERTQWRERLRGSRGGIVDYKGVNM